MHIVGRVERREELQLLSAVIAGDVGASRSFFERYNFTVEQCVRRVLRRQCRAVSEADVQDMVSEIWVALLENDKRPLRRFDPQREIRVTTWIGLLARNKTIDRLRASHEPFLSLDDETQVAEAPSASPLPQDFLEERERQELMGEAMKELSAEERRFLEAWYSEEREPEALAEQLGISLGTVYSRRFKIQAKLARAIRRLDQRRRISLQQRTLH